MSLTSKIRVAVLRGGPSSEYDVSLQTGDTVLKNLPEKYQGIDVLIDKHGVWHVAGLPKSPGEDSSPERWRASSPPRRQA